MITCEACSSMTALLISSLTLTALTCLFGNARMQRVWYFRLDSRLCCTYPMFLRSHTSTLRPAVPTIRRSPATDSVYTWNTWQRERVWRRSESGRRSESAQYLLRLGESAGVARGPRIPQPHAHVPAARYHDVDLWTILHASYRSVVCSHDRVYRAGKIRSVTVRQQYYTPCHHTHLHTFGLASQVSKKVAELRG